MNDNIKFPWRVELSPITDVHGGLCCKEIVGIVTAHDDYYQLKVYEEINGQSANGSTIDDVKFLKEHTLTKEEFLELLNDTKNNKFNRKYY